MISTLVLLVKNIVNSGIPYAENYEQSKRIVLSNTLSLVFIGLSIPYSFLFLYLGSYFMGGIVIPCISLFSVSILLRRFGKQSYAGLSFVIAVAVVIYFYSAVFGPAAGIQYMFFPLMAGTSILFFGQETRYRRLAFVIILLFYLVLEGSQYAFFFHENYGHAYLMCVRLSIVVNALVILMFVVHFQLEIANHTQMALVQILNRYNLTRRESEIVLHLCKGQSNKEIGETLFIEEGTVKVHLKSIYRKLNVKNRTEVVSFFVMGSGVGLETVNDSLVA